MMMMIPLVVSAKEHMVLWFTLTETNFHGTHYYTVMITQCFLQICVGADGCVYGMCLKRKGSSAYAYIELPS